MSDEKKLPSEVKALRKRLQGRKRYSKAKLAEIAELDRDIKFLWERIPKMPEGLAKDLAIAAAVGMMYEALHADT